MFKQNNNKKYDGHFEPAVRVNQQTSAIENTIRTLKSVHC